MNPDAPRTTHHDLLPGQSVHVSSKDNSFPAKVTDTRPGWVKVFGTDASDDLESGAVFFHEWLPITADRLAIRPASSPRNTEHAP